MNHASGRRSLHIKTSLICSYRILEAELGKTDHTVGSGTVKNLRNRSNFSENRSQTPRTGTEPVTSLEPAGSKTGQGTPNGFGPFLLQQDSWVTAELLYNSVSTRLSTRCRLSGFRCSKHSEKNISGILETFFISRSPQKHNLDTKLTDPKKREKWKKFLNLNHGSWYHLLGLENSSINQRNRITIGGANSHTRLLQNTNP